MITYHHRRVVRAPRRPLPPAMAPVPQPTCDGTWLLRRLQQRDRARAVHAVSDLAVLPDWALSLATYTLLASVIWYLL